MDIKSNKYILNRNFFNDLKVGDLAEKNVKGNNGKIEKINYDNGLCLGIVLLFDDNNKIARIIMGLPTVG